jgi:hypothetical protein
MLRTLALAAGLATLGACAQSTAASHDQTGPAWTAESEPHQVVTGRVAAVDPGRNVLLVDRGSGDALLLRLTPGTIVTQDGGPAKANDIREGSPVRAAYHAAYGENQALLIDVSRQGAFPPEP